MTKMEDAHNKFGHLYDMWKWLMACPFGDAQPFVETAWNAGMTEAQEQAYEALGKLNNIHINKWLIDLEMGENSEDEVYNLIETELNK
jgi:hypothetical protein